MDWFLTRYGSVCSIPRNAHASSIGMGLAGRRPLVEGCGKTFSRACGCPSTLWRVCSVENALCPNDKRSPKHLHTGAASRFFFFLMYKYVCMCIFILYIVFPLCPLFHLVIKQAFYHWHVSLM